ncbi:MAG: phospho-sugar mutase [Actinomycetota bacterium]
MTLTDSLQHAVEAWMSADHDPDCVEELTHLVETAQDQELLHRFTSPLTFGTAGLRGPVQAGPAGMNRRTVRRTTQGVVTWLATQGADAFDRGVVVGCDARHGSSDFYDEVLRVLQFYGVLTIALPSQLPTPLVPWTVQLLGAAAGIMITASHNPAADNGYKLYVGDGAQVHVPDDEFIERAASSSAELGALLEAPVDTSTGLAAVAAYLDHVAVRWRLAEPSTMRVVYTPVCGVGGITAREVLIRCGYPNLILVDSQMRPDPDFGGLAFPNPEESGVLEAALALGREHSAHIIIANDPDADRLAVAVASPHGDWVTLTGDEVGWILGDAALRRGLDSSQVLATSLVSSSLLGRMASSRGATMVTTLTGFKWIARAGVATGRQLAFGYEEALGYAVDPLVADKDGISAAVALLQVANEQHEAQRTLLDLLNDIRREFGDVVVSQVSVRAANDGDWRVLCGVVENLSTHAPSTLGGWPVTATTDLSIATPERASTPGVVFALGHHGRVVIRPSGTEPKVKAYLEVVRDSPRDDTMTQLRNDVRQLLTPTN